ncbi:hypothetical protein IWX85_000392 [Polaromonas sp. CG_9.11]|nr:hypothetical protein [Polaromonas sp. CG_9.11]
MNHLELLSRPEMTRQLVQWLCTAAWPLSASANSSAI